jgi:hypothetical protein
MVFAVREPHWLDRRNKQELQFPSHDMKERNNTYLDQLAGAIGHRYVYWVTLSMTQ